MNFSFITPREHFSRKVGLDIVLRALRKLDVPAFSTERNDICLHPNLKISGSAYKIARQKACHHGTLLVNADLAVLKNCLKFNEAIIETKATQSISSNVTNITKDYGHVTIERLQNEITHSFLEGDSEKMQQDDSFIVQVDKFTSEEIESSMKLLKSDEFIYGRTPFFKFKQTALNCEIFGSVENGKVTEISIPYNPILEREFRLRIPFYYRRNFQIMESVET